MRLFADNPSLVTCVRGIDQTQQTTLGFTDYSTWAYQWKKVFTTDISKQAIEVIFLCKNNRPSHPEPFLVVYQLQGIPLRNTQENI